MNKGDLAAAVADKTGMSKSSASQAVEAVFGCITDSLKKGQEVRVLGFGNFTVGENPNPTLVRIGYIISGREKEICCFTAFDPGLIDVS